ncbi:MAG: hypothetical protein ABJA93_01750 [Sporichthyaceae bacterium]
MPRQNRRQRDDPSDLEADQLARGAGRRETGPEGDWLVRSVAGAAATKTYRCPGCDQEIRPGMAHLVVWPDGISGADSRRHWHTPCWRARSRRTPGTVRSRNAPRY